MEGIASAVAINQAMTRYQTSLEVVRMALENQQEIAALLSQAQQSGLVPAASPDHLGRMLDTYA